MPVLLHTLSAIPGGGKSVTVHKAAAESARQGESVLLTVPTVDLADEAAAHIRALAPDVCLEVIHHEVTPARVGAAVLAALKARPKRGRILIITWSAFEARPYFPDPGRWTLFVDEIPQAAMSIEVKAPQSHVHLTQHLELRALGPSWSRLLVKKRGALKKLAQTRDAALKGDLASMARLLLSPHWSAYVRTAGYAALVAGKGQKLTLQFVLRPRIFERFKRVTILGANLEHSLIFLIWQAQGVVFEEDEALKARLRLTEHKNGDTVTILYGVEDDWSKALRDRQKGEVWKRLVPAVRERFGGMKFGWIANKDIDNPFTGLDAVCLPQVSHGLNEFQHLDNIVFLSARLPPPEHINFLGWLGVDPDPVRRAIYYEAGYQTVLRCSIRDPENRNAKLVFVPDRRAAEFLQDLLPGSRVEKLPIDWRGVTFKKRPGRPKKHASGTGRVQHHRAKKKAEINRMVARMHGDPATISTGELAALHRLKVTAIPAGSRGVLETCNDIPIEEGNQSSVSETRFTSGTGPNGTLALGAQGSVPQVVVGSLFESEFATHPIDIVAGDNIEDFIKALRELNREKVKKKEDRCLICPAVFDPDLSPETFRGLDNVVYANGVWLDFDKGNLTHKEFASIFPQLRMVAFNSYSSTKAQPRFRIFVPTSRTVTRSEYAGLTEQILQVVKDAGYRHPGRDPHRPHLKSHGIDTGKLHAASLFYLPCQPADPKGKIWKDHNGDGRAALDVDNWLENAIPVETDDYEPVPKREREDDDWDRARAARAMDRWNLHGTTEGRGDTGLYILAMELKGADAPAYEAKDMLMQAARGATSPADRLRQAQRLLKKHWASG